MKLTELIIAVKEKNLNKDQLESYRTDMSEIFAQMQMEMADLEKSEALFMGGEWLGILSPTIRTKDPSVAQIKIWWKATEKGQRLIVLKRYCLATKELLNSLKSRLYSIY